MATEPAPEVLRWVREGEQLFGQLLGTLHRYRELESTVDRLTEENRRLHTEMQAIREELHQLLAERLDAAETMKAIAEQVTRLATAALQRLARPRS
jgi:regulator of replication initiation timing